MPCFELMHEALPESNHNCFATTTNRIMKAAKVLAVLAVSATAFEECERQKVFDIVMCKSHMCTDCVLEWCTETCQWVQQEFVGCRCEDWPEARKSFSGGEFAGKGKFGDAGDFGR